jgi:predicted double-glycine peptidase
MGHLPSSLPLWGVLAALSAQSAPAQAQAMFNLAGDTVSVPVTSMRDMPFRTVVRQQYDYSCGSAALATLLRHHYGRTANEADIFRAMYATGDQAKIQKVGFSLLDMKVYLNSVGLKADGYRYALRDLEQLKAPVIVLIKIADYRHFVVIKGVRRGQVLVGDPARGLKVYPEAEFAKLWNGVVFVVHPGRTTFAYNRADEWGSLGRGPFNPLDDTALASFTRDLLTFNQIVVVPTGGGVIR